VLALEIDSILQGSVRVRVRVRVRVKVRVRRSTPYCKAQL